jgi:hypothetical protein
MKKRRLAVLVAMSAAMASAAWAAGSQTGTISALYVRSDGLEVVSLTGSHGGAPACATQPYWIVMDENATFGKTQYATLLAAQLAGKQVLLSGAGTCTRWHDGEDIFQVYVYP